MSETYTTKKEKIVSVKNINQYIEIKGDEYKYSEQGNLLKSQFYDYTVNSSTGNITINRDNPQRFGDREEIGTLNIKTKKIEYTENANDYEKFWMNKDESISNVVKKSQKKLFDEGFTPEKISEILPSNQSKGNGNNLELNSIGLPVDRGEDKSRKS